MRMSKFYHGGSYSLLASVLLDVYFGVISNSIEYAAYRVLYWGIAEELVYENE